MLGAVFINLYGPHWPAGAHHSFSGDPPNIEPRRLAFECAAEWCPIRHFAGPEYRSGSSITASALSSDTSQLRAGSGVKGVPRQQGVISTLDAADGSPEWNSGTKSSAVDWTSSLGRIFRADLSTKARLLESCGGPRFVHQSSMRSSRP